MPGRRALTVCHAITPSHQTHQGISPMERYERLLSGASRALVLRGLL